MTRLRPGTIWPTPAEESEINAGIALDPDNPELTDEDFARMRPAVEVVPEIVAQYRAEQARKAKESRLDACKTRVTIRLDADVVARLREDGPGWQTRANAALRRALFGS